MIVKVEQLYYLIFLYWDKTYKEPTGKQKKPFSKRPKGWGWSGSPYWTRSELLMGILQ